MEKKAKKNKSLLSIIIPAYNEEKNIKETVNSIVKKIEEHSIPYEIIVVNDNSKDKTLKIIQHLAKKNPNIILVNRKPPEGFGRAIRSGLEKFKGDIMIPVMGDLSDDPKDIIKYYYKIEEGYDCVFGSRFTKKSHVSDYPLVKLIFNRIINKAIQLLFLTRHNDLTNAFKAYRKEVIQNIMPLHAAHFNITIELSLSALIRKYKIASLPVNWFGRQWGQSNLKLRAMGRRYLATLLKIWFERLLILDDIIAEESEIKKT